MKAWRFLFTLSVLTFVFSPQLVTRAAAPASGGTIYSATLVSPTAGQILYPGQRIRVEWKSTLPNVNLDGCETEVWLSLDGGRTFPTCITPVFDPKVRFFYWIVPNMPTNQAVLDVRFGCEGWYPESYSPQAASTFSIATATAGVY